ncbi:hypothetical protein BDB00DRAFT_862523 [Zychaea mexicana]|uniref:uncharacterized protein n=1 Tax=Zychaea mexicana TaxID=64656 RepID=UPI0022FF0CD7|nr:uncharacterized protein BDB00DRAFT_862523 [Zychaea mexicana]KAI9471367.1 hypothetical protein BDB00DRAFT_862523 [Zychaea mexicana]
MNNNATNNNNSNNIQGGLNLSGAITDNNNSNQPHEQQRTQDSNNNNMMMVASLDQIWVFRASNSNANTTANVWITFDYNNQHLLTKHKKKLDKLRIPYDEGVDVFDSHIRQGKLPVLVFPSRKQAYYPTNLSGDEIISIEVACIPNSRDLQFVYRQHQQQQ